MFYTITAEKKFKKVLTHQAPIPQNVQTLKQLVGNLPTNCLSVLGHFVGLAPKGLKNAPVTDALHS